MYIFSYIKDCQYWKVELSYFWVHTTFESHLTSHLETLESFLTATFDAPKPWDWFLNRFRSVCRFCQYLKNTKLLNKQQSVTILVGIFTDLNVVIRKAFYPPSLVYNKAIFFLIYLLILSNPFYLFSHFFQFYQLSVFNPFFLFNLFYSFYLRWG